jgi:3-phosphoshikimate 1-carboxyvinyltransferase
VTAFVVHPATGPLGGDLRVPGDKSIGHRALLFSLLSSRPVRVHGLGDGADNGRSARAIAALGARLVPDGDSVIIHGTGLRGMRAPAAPLDCGNSGTTIRLLCGLVAGQPFATTLVGDESLSKRPMRRVAEPLGRMGVPIRGATREAQPSLRTMAGRDEPPFGATREAQPSLRTMAGRDEPSFGATGSGDLVPPLIVGPVPAALTAIDYAMPVASAQVKSAIVLAALYADGTTVITEPGPGRDHTERLLRHFGAPIRVDGNRIEVAAGGWDGRLAGDAIRVPGDPSSSAFLLAAAIVAGSRGLRIRAVGVNPTRTGFLDALAAMGAGVALADGTDEGGEPVADLELPPGPAPALAATTIAGDLTVRAIDEVPILAVIAARAAGETVIRDAEELRVKESDRIATTVAMLRAFGVDAEARPDGLAVRGTAGAPFRAARVHAEGDHRIAMAAAIAGLAADGPTRIDDAANVATSYPGFVAALRALGAAIDVEAA